jgi:hypothetical protein
VHSTTLRGRSACTQYRRGGVLSKTAGTGSGQGRCSSAASHGRPR